MAERVNLRRGRKMEESVQTPIGDGLFGPERERERGQ